MAVAKQAPSQSLEVELNQHVPIRLQAKFVCAPGEMLALVGPSGGGKTTILRSIAGLYDAARGRIYCDQQVWFDDSNNVSLSPQERRVGFVFQDYALFPHLCVQDNVAIAIENGHQRDRLARACHLLEQVNLAGLEQRFPHALSGGQQQRVAIARALARDPKVLLLDEPFSAVDQVTRRKLRQELAELRRELRIPVILVTHDLEEAGMLADTLCILHRGETLQTGEPFDVMRRPTSLSVARLLDHANLFEGQVLDHDESMQRTRITWFGETLECRYQPLFTVGSKVAWVIPSSEVLLHRRDRPSRGERENPINGTIVGFLPLGETASVTMVTSHAKNQQLVFSVPTHVAHRNRLAEGGAARVSLLADAITLMPRAIANG